MYALDAVGVTGNKQKKNRVAMSVFIKPLLVFSTFCCWDCTESLPSK